MTELRWRLQHIAEEEVGVRVRAARAAEDQAAGAAAENLG